MAALDSVNWRLEVDGNGATDLLREIRFIGAA